MIFRGRLRRYFWNLVHSCLVHPLMGLLSFRRPLPSWLLAWHDRTARKAWPDGLPPPDSREAWDRSPMDYPSETTFLRRSGDGRLEYRVVRKGPYLLSIFTEHEPELGLTTRVLGSCRGIDYSFTAENPDASPAAESPSSSADS